MNKNRKAIIITLFVAIWLVFGVGYIAVKYFNVNSSIINDIKKAEKGILPTVGSEEKLRKLLEESSSANYVNPWIPSDMGGVIAPNASGAMGMTESKTSNYSYDYSKTNVQVQGVDEADIVKTDGKYIYSISNGKIIVSEVYPTDSMQIKIKLFENESNNCYANEMILDDKYLTVICSENRVYAMESRVAVDYIPSYSGDKITILIYDISNKQDIKKVKTYEIKGGYLTSRQKDKSIYIVSNQYVYLYTDTQTQDIMPKYSVDGVEKTLEYKDIYYFPDTKSSSYTNIAVIDLNDINKDINVTSYLSSSQTVYMSLDNLYIAANTSTYDAVNLAYTYKPNTSIYKFSASSDTVTFVAKRELEGTLLNQFSMDENKGYFRVTLTDENSNSLYVLDSKMNIAGSILKIAEGEKIYSTRFMGDRAYVVTFKTIDPLFVIDLKDPYSPKILGELKIPGYSSYLHPYDDNHIIGIGQDTKEIQDKDSSGNVIDTRYVVNGMKMAIFDVTDVTKPKEKFSMKIGSKSTYSDVLYNHKAFLFSKEKNLLAFPIQTYRDVIAFDTNLNSSEVSSSSPSSSSMSSSSYYKGYYQGYMVYSIDLDKGFVERGSITHYSQDNINNYRYTNTEDITRGLFINNILYTVSNNQIKANDLDTLKELNSLYLNK